MVVSAHSAPAAMTPSPLDASARLVLQSPDDAFESPAETAVGWSHLAWSSAI